MLLLVKWRRLFAEAGIQAGFEYGQEGRNCSGGGAPEQGLRSWSLLLGRLERYHVWLELHDVVFQTQLD